MSTRETKAQDIGSAHKILLQDLQTICDAIEYGQSRKPLADACQHLQTGMEQTSLKLSVVTFGATSLAAVLAWLGADSKQRAKVARSKFCLMLQWWTNMPGTASSASRNLHASVARVEAFGDDRPDRFQTFCAHGHLLVILIDHDARPTPQETEVLNELLTCFSTVLPVVLKPTEKPLPWQDWLNFSGAVQLLPELIAPSAADSQWLKEPEAPLRQALRVRSNLAELDAVAIAASERIEREIAYADAGLEISVDGGQPAMRLNRGRKDDKRAELIRRLAIDKLNEMDERITLENERLIQPLGGLSHLVRDAANRIRVEDLSRDVSSQAIRLRLRSHQVVSYNRKLVDALQGQLRADLGNMDTQLTSLESNLSRQFDEHFESPSDVQLPRLDFRRVWERIENLVDVGEEATIELERKTLFDLMGAGRQKVFFLIMFVALLGRMGIDEQAFSGLLPDVGTNVLGWLKAGFMVLLCSTCLGAMFNAMLLWREESEEQTQKELERIREALIADAQKTLELAQKEKRSVVKTYIKSVQEGAQAWLDQSVAERLAQEQVEAEHRQREQQRMREALQQRKSELIAADKAVTRIIDEIRQLRISCGSWLQRASLPGAIVVTDVVTDIPATPASDPPTKSAAGPVEVKLANSPKERRERTRKVQPATKAKGEGITSRFAQRRAQRKLLAEKSA